MSGVFSGKAQEALQWAAGNETGVTKAELDSAYVELSLIKRLRYHPNMASTLFLWSETSSMSLSLFLITEEN